MGRRANLALAYIAGFLDGDGSLMLQIKHRKDGKRNWRFMATICLYQDIRHEETLHWIRKILGIGYISHRNDGITELRINGFSQVEKTLSNLLPHIRFKKVQASQLLEAVRLLSVKPLRLLSESDLRQLVGNILAIQSENYATKSKKSKDELFVRLGLTP